MDQALTRHVSNFQSDATAPLKVKVTSLNVKRKPKCGRRDSKNKENQTRNTFKIKTKPSVKANSKRTSKFALMSLINSTRSGAIKDRSLEERLRYFRFFSDKTNTLQLLKSKHTTSFEQRYLEFRTYEHEANAELPPTEDRGVYFKMLTSGAKIVEQVLRDNELCAVRSNSKPSLFWSGSAISSELYASLDSHQKINHFPKSNEISRKDFMFLNITRMKQKFPRDFDFIPNSFVLPRDHGLLVKAMESGPRSKAYICKPVASSQGKGIFITADIAEVD